MNVIAALPADTHDQNVQVVDLSFLKAAAEVQDTLAGAKEIRAIIAQKMSHSGTIGATAEALSNMTNALIQKTIMTFIPHKIAELMAIPPSMESRIAASSREVPPLVQAWIAGGEEDTEKVTCFVDGAFSPTGRNGYNAGVGIIALNEAGAPIMAVSAAIAAESAFDAEKYAYQLATKICAESGVQIEAVKTDSKSLIESTKSEIPLIHIYGHDGNWWNEMADALATQGRFRGWSTYPAALAEPQPCAKQKAPSDPIHLMHYMPGKTSPVKSPILILPVPACDGYECGRVAILLYSRKGTISSVNVFRNQTESMKEIASFLSKWPNKTVFIHRPDHDMLSAIDLAIGMAPDSTNFVRWDWEVPKIRPEALEAAIKTHNATRKAPKTDGSCQIIGETNICHANPKLYGAIKHWHHNPKT